jgi:septal ring factor EnvC (AmiA/AmiB activator)
MIALQPPEALLVAPTAPIDTVRGALLLRVAVANIERRAKALRADLDDLARLRRQIAAQMRALAPKLVALESERARLARLVARKRALRSVVFSEQRAAQRRAERLAADAKDLVELIDRLERAAREKAEREARELVERKARELVEREAAARRLAETRRRADEKAARQQAELSRPPAPMRLQKPANVRSFPSAPGAASLVMPARGRVVMRFGQETEEGGVSSGVTIATRRAAQVVAPYDGQVAYAGIFRGYGQILIIEHGGRYHTLLAGLDRLGAVVGQWVLAGEPVGTMGRPEDRNPELYLELRRTGQPINPLPWLATTNDKVRG